MSQNGEAEDFGVEARKELRRILLGIGLRENELLALIAAELRHRGCRPRKAWRLANDLTQQEVAEELNRLTGKPTAPMKASRISEYESWPGPEGKGRNRPRPTLEMMKNLAAIYRTSWDQLVDVEDLTCMPSSDVKAFRDAVAANCTTVHTAIGGGLPAGLVPFVGRAKPQQQLRERVEAHLNRTGPPVHVINGLAGVGKTALARSVVQNFAEHYPDGVIWENLRGHTDGRPPRTPEGVLEQLLLRIGVLPETIETDIAQRAARWRREMRDRRMLIVFDNVLESTQVRALLPDARGCFVLITSRHKLTALSGSVPLQLDAMEPLESEEMLVELAHLPADYDVEAARRVLRAAGGLPLAIRLIAGQIAHHGPDLLSAAAAEFMRLAERMRQGPEETSEESVAERALDYFSAEGETLRAAFELSYKRLPDPELQRAVRLLGWFPSTEITAETLAPMAGVTQAQAYGLIRQIFEVGLLDPAETGPGQRYRIHDVTRLFARVQADAEDAQSEHPAAVGRLVRHCLRVAGQVGAPRPYEAAGSFPKGPGGDPSGATLRAQDWLNRERELLLGCIRVGGSEADTGELARLLGAHLSELGHWSDARWLFVRALAIARGNNDRTTECDVLFDLGSVYRRSCDYDTAAKCFEEAHTISIELDDALRMAASLWGYAEVRRHIGDFDRARSAYADVVGIARRLEHRKFEGDALRGLGHIERMSVDDKGGDLEIAHGYYLDSLRIATEIGDPYSLGWSLWGLGFVSRVSGEYLTARGHLEKAHAISLEMNDRILQVDTLRGLGHIERAVGDLDAAQEYYSDSLDRARRNRDPHGEADALRSLADLALIAGSQWRPCDLYCKALLLYESMGMMLADQVRGELAEALERCKRKRVKLPARVQEDLHRLGFEI
ncbi:tetratricopeptide repeat protein [Nocardia sp. NPDC051030]|uniref:tetratricopeptide repeat protein n=1 Tax=Nocardia sp. NPDC051030 TaxID=3155162 RepID=UPI00341BC73E